MCARTAGKKAPEQENKQEKKEAVKKNLSSIQVLKTLQLLLEGNFTMTELVKELNRRENEPVFNNSVVSKYINTCRHCGIEILKIHNRYFVVSVPFGLDLSLREMDRLNELQYIVATKLSKSLKKEFKSFMEKICRYSNKRIVKLEEKNKQITFGLYDTAIAEKKFIELKFRANAVLKCIPLCISDKKGKPCFIVSYEGKERQILLERLTGFEVLDENFVDEPLKTQDVIFRLTGGLAKRYTLRENETVVGKSEEGIDIKAPVVNKPDLFARLLRYDKDCEILQPAHYRQEMIGTINQMLAKYE